MTQLEIKQKEELGSSLFIFILCLSIYLAPLAVFYYVLRYLRRWTIDDLRNPKGKLSYPYFFLGVNALLSSLFSLNSISIAATVGLFLPFLLFAVYVEDEFTPTQSIHTLRLLVYFSFPVALYSFIQKLFFPLIQGRPYATFYNANLYAFFLMMVLLIALGLFLESHSTKERCLYVLISTANLAALLLTESRSAFVALAVAGLFFLLFNKRYQLAIVLMAVLGLFIYSVIINPHLIPRYTVLDSNIAQREQLWDIAWDAIRSNPFMGRGLLSYKYYALQYNVQKLHSHNTLLNIWMEWGIVGVALFTWSQYLIFRRGLWGLAHSPQRVLIASLLSCMMAAMVHGIADHPVGNVQTGIIYFMLTSMIMVFTRDNQ